jgi:N-acetylneuraminic acid mutarotase
MKLPVRLMAIGASLVLATVACAGPAPASSPSTLPSASTVLLPTAAAGVSTPIVTPAATASPWRLTTPLGIGRIEHTATRLVDGDVLVAGGRHITSDPNATALDETLDSVVIFDPAAEAWHSAATLHEPRSRHQAVRLADGRVLVAGGFSPRSADQIAHTIEIYDPTTNTWTSGSMPLKGFVVSTTVLADTRVLMVGYLGSTGAVATRDHQAFAILDPNTMVWSSVGTTDAIVGGHSAVLLHDGRVLAAGGAYAVGDGPPPPAALAAVFTPATGRWTKVDPMNHERLSFAMTVLPDGRVLTADEGTAEICDPASGHWATTGAPRGPWDGAIGVGLADGRVLLIGEHGSLDSRHLTELYDPAKGSWRDVGPFPPTSGLTATLLGDGRVFVTGGLITCYAGTGCQNDTLTGDSYLLDPTGLR